MTNCYGPTEITAAATFQTVPLKEMNHERSIYAVGKALPNYTVSILDASGRAQPVEHRGEICIGGAGVALGYLDLPDETNRKFIVNQQNTQRQTPGHRFYRTGDQGKLMPDGTLLCLGRLDGDTQVKLRGLRVELQEVGTALLHAANGLLAAAIVSHRGNILLAHATLSSNSESLDEAALSQILGRLRLPQYFIPVSIVLLPRMPTTANGKIDRRAIAALPLPNPRSGAHKEAQEKMNICEGELRLLWERTLPDIHTTARINPSSDFFLCGGNSLLLMKLQAAIKESMGVKISTRALYQASTLPDMAHSIDEQREEQARGNMQEIDWAAETAVPSWLLEQLRELPALSKVPRRNEKEGFEILMTGATSFLGGCLLRSLVSSPAVRKVHCIAVLADDQHRLQQHEKIKCYMGSLLSSTLGLSTNDRMDLEQTVDVILHAGSNGRCLNTYSSVRTSNLLSTQFLVSLALGRSIPLLILSSNRVVLLSGNTAPPPASVAPFPPATDGLEDHMASKWASEVFLENLVTQLQASTNTRLQSPWTVVVHRPCVVVSEQAPNSDALNAILRYSLSMRCVPRLARVEGFMDFGQVDSVVDDIAKAALQLAAAYGQNHVAAPSIRFRHHSGGVKTPASEFRNHMENVYGGKFEEAGVTEWMDRASQAGIDPLITAYLEGILKSGAPMVFPYLGGK